MPLMRCAISAQGTPTGYPPQGYPQVPISAIKTSGSELRCYDMLCHVMLRLRHVCRGRLRATRRQAFLHSDHKHVDGSAIADNFN